MGLRIEPIVPESATGSAIPALPTALRVVLAVGTHYQAIIPGDECLGVKALERPVVATTPAHH
jgi:hypothetical protein